MIKNPFKIFNQFSDHLTVAIFNKADEKLSDNQAAEALGGTAGAGVNQVHGNQTVIVEGATAREPEADGMITAQPGLALCTRWADCQNFVIYVPEKEVLGTLHVGWRCLIADAIPMFFKTLEKNFKVTPEQTWVGSGPSLCQKCADFSNPEEELPQLDKKYFADRCVDLRQAATDQFFGLGVPANQFERMPDCTRCQPEDYWTYRGGDKEEVLAGHTNMLAACLARPSL